MQKSILKLAAHLLKEYSNKLSCNSCNDTSKEVLNLMDVLLGDENFKKMAE